MIKFITAAILAVTAFAAQPASAQGSRCRETCAPALRECLQQGRPALRTCLTDCRAAQPHGACPDGVDAEDCPGASGLRECIGVCRDARRAEIRACVQAGIACNNGCHQSRPTPTATPLK